MPQEEGKLTITYGSMIRFILVLIVAVFLYFIRDIVLILFLSIVLSAAFEPLVAWFERRNLPRGFGVIVVYIAIFFVLSLVAVVLAPLVALQVKLLSAHLPLYYEKIVALANIGGRGIIQQGGGSIETFSQALASLSKNILPAVRGAVGGGISVFLTLVLTFYFSVEDRGLKRFLRSILPVPYQPYFTRMTHRVEERIGRWFRGQLLLSGIIFVVMAISLFIIHTITGLIPFWLVLAVIAGMLEVIPFLGPVISIVIAVALVLSSSFWLAVAVLALYIVVQQLENHILVPKIMQRAVGLNPIVVILVIVIGGRLAGILGSLIAIPLAAAAQVFISDMRIGEEEKHIEADGLGV